MAGDKPRSPISQVLHSLGLTRDDLNRRSDQMRQFLTAENSSSLRPFSPLTATVKSEQTEPALSLLNFDSMDSVIERQSRQSRKEKKSRKVRDKNHTFPVPRRSPSPRRAFSSSSTSSSSKPRFSLDAFMELRDGRRVSATDLERSATPQDVWAHPPVTPQRRSYYRDHNGETKPSPRSPPPRNHYREQHTTVPATPRGHMSPLHSSSPSGACSSPLSSPNKPIVNTVSSPGPMGPLPLEEDYDDLPYTLPPGPYLSTKPELSYAALVGQAILSSPQHRLTLQELYDWITIVYPYFRRGETTWMNSIRHVLSTTACFRKVIRERSIGRTLWAIWDDDLPCFDGGGFRKNLCKDMENAKLGHKKRTAVTEGESSVRRSKKSRKDKAVVPSSDQTYDVPATQAFPMFPTTHAAPMFPPIRPTTHHQTYYESCLPQTMPAGIIFPPLPPSSSYEYRQATGTSAMPILVPETHSQSETQPEDPQPVAPAPPSPPPADPPLSMPELTPNRSSSLSPGVLPDPSGPTETNDVVRVTEDSNDNVFGGEPLLGRNVGRKKGGEKKKGKGHTKNEKKIPGLPPVPSSPTINRKTTKQGKHSSHALDVRPVTPPPRARHTHNSPTISSVRTPLSHKGLHMSPSASLAHYKSNLDPPPPTTFFNGELEGDNENVHTPPRAKRSSFGTTSLVTPRKLVFNATGIAATTTTTAAGIAISQSQESPFRTPGSRLGFYLGLGAASPAFRTPGTRGIFDPYDASAMLDEELSRLGGAGQLGGISTESPAGLVGSRFYESPGTGSPGKWPRWW